MTTQYFDPRPIHLNALGQVISNGRLSFFDPDTLNPKEVFSDYDLTISAGSVVNLDSSGRLPNNIPQLWYGYGVYYVTLEDFATGVWTQVWEAPRVYGSADPDASASTDFIICNTIADLRAVDPASYTKATVIGSVAVSEGGGGDYRWVSSSVATDDSGWTIQSNLSGTGRWFRTLEAGTEALDIKIWGAQSNYGPIDGIVAWATAKAASYQLPIYFPAGFWLFQDSYLISADVVIDQGAKFGTTADVDANITFSGKVEIRSSIALTTTDNTKLYFGATNLQQIKIEWGYNHTEAGIMCVNSGLPLYITSPTTLNGNVSVSTFAVILGNRSSLNVSTYILSAGQFIVEGVRRKVITGSTNPILSRQDNIEGWWFGYGVDAGTADHKAFLQYADTVANANAVPLVLDRMNTGSIATTYGIVSPVTVNSPISISGSAILTIKSFAVMPFRRIFNTTGTAIGVVNNVSANPLWWGVSSANVASVNWAAWIDMLQSVNINQELVDGQNMRFDIPGGADVCGGIVGLTSLRLYNMVINSTTADVSVFVNTSKSVLECHNVRLLPNGLVPAIYMLTSTDNGFYVFKGCELKSGILFGMSGNAQFLEVCECESWNNGSIAVLSGQNQTISIHNNHVNAGNIITATISNAYLNNISILDNTFINCDTTYGDIQLSTSVLNTYVNNVIIEGNKFTWVGGASEKILISPILSGVGTWASFQNVSVANNSINGTHTIPNPASETDLGLVQGPYCSGTRGNETYKLPSHAALNETYSSYSDSVNVRIGPFFIGVTKIFEPNNIGLNAEAYYSSSASLSCQQVDGIAVDGLVIKNVISNLAEDQGHLTLYDVDGRFRVGRLTLSFEAKTSNDAFTYPMQGRVILHWGHRCDIGRASRTF